MFFFMFSCNIFRKNSVTSSSSLQKLFFSSCYLFLQFSRLKMLLENKAWSVLLLVYSIGINQITMIGSIEVIPSRNIRSTKTSHVRGWRWGGLCGCSSDRILIQRVPWLRVITGKLHLHLSNFLKSPFYLDFVSYYFFDPIMLSFTLDVVYCSFSPY